MFYFYEHYFCLFLPYHKRIEFKDIFQQTYRILSFAWIYSNYFIGVIFMTMYEFEINQWVNMMDEMYNRLFNNWCYILDDRLIIQKLTHRLREH